MVVNTGGWVQGLGLEFLGETVQCSEPTHVVMTSTNAPLVTTLKESLTTSTRPNDLTRSSIQEPSPSSVNGSLTSWTISNCCVFQLNAKIPKRHPSNNSKTGAKLRDLRLITYFGDAAQRELHEEEIGVQGTSVTHKQEPAVKTGCNQQNDEDGDGFAETDRNCWDWWGPLVEGGVFGATSESGLAKVRCMHGFAFTCDVDTDIDTVH